MIADVPVNSALVVRTAVAGTSIVTVKSSVVLLIWQAWLLQQSLQQRLAKEVSCECQKLHPFGGYFALITCSVTALY